MDNEKNDDEAGETGNVSNGDKIQPELLATARHEAGHAVIALVNGFSVTSLDIMPKVVPNSGGQKGLAGVDLQLPSLNHIIGEGEESVWGVLTTLYAGYLAEKAVNPEAELEMHHPNADGIVAGNYAVLAICPPRLIDGNLVSRTDVKDRDQIRSLCERAKEEARVLVKRHSHAIDLLTNLLVSKQLLRRDEILRCMSPFLNIDGSDCE